MALSEESNAGLEIKVLGSLGVYRDGRELTLPQSRKTRALLAYLATVDRPPRRERLCEIFWEVPDDPRGALRWSISKLRQILGDALDSGHDAVAINPKRVRVDYHRVRNAVSSDLRMATVPDLEDFAGLFRGPFLDDLSLPRCPIFDAWRLAMANEVELTELRLRRTLIDRLTKANPGRALVHAQALMSLRPDDRALAAEIEGLLENSRDALSHSAHAEESQPAPASSRKIFQDIRYCTAVDGTRIAYAVSGNGYPILKCANWISHLQYEWESPVWRHWMEGLSAENRLIRYDQRGNGLSDWNVAHFSFEAMVGDLESVADAAGLQRFALLGISGGCAMSVAYAAHHPDRVSHLILYGGRAKGWRVLADPSEVARRAAMITLIRAGWAQDNPAFRRMFASLFIPDATPEQVTWFDQLQRRTIPAENAAAWQEQSSTFDVTDLLKRVTAPTLVLNSTKDGITPFEGGREFAAGIRDARFVPLESGNHILLHHEPAFAELLDEITRFINA